jgi:O-antigen ligase
MTRFELDNPEDTSQHRIRLWSDGLQLFRESPLFGIGQGEYAGHAGQVAHNSYIEAYTELGFVGGTCFLGLFAYTGLALWRLRRFNAALDPALRRLHPYLFAILATLAVGFTSLSRVYTPTTYVLFGLFAAYLRLAARQVPKSVPHLTATLVVRLAALSALSLVTLHVITTTMVRWT